jgi:hypothetical protein
VARKVDPPVGSVLTPASSKYSGRMPAISRPLPSALAAFSAGSSTEPNGSFTEVPSTVAGRKFIGGEPMKPATKRLPGFS